MRAFEAQFENSMLKKWLYSTVSWHGFPEINHSLIIMQTGAENDLRASFGVPGALQVDLEAKHRVISSPSLSPDKKSQPCLAVRQA